MNPKSSFYSVLLGFPAGIALAYGPILGANMLYTLYFPSSISIDGQGALLLLASVPVVLFSTAIFIACILLFHYYIVRPQKEAGGSIKQYIGIFVLAVLVGLISVPLGNANNKRKAQQKVVALENNLYKVIDGIWYTKGKNEGYTFTFSYERNKYPVAGVDKDEVFLHGTLLIQDSSKTILCEAPVNGYSDPEHTGTYGLTANCLDEIDIPLFEDFKSNRYLSFNQVQVVDEKLILTHENSLTKKRVHLILTKQP